MKYHAYKSNGLTEKKFKASTPKRLREFIEAYWLNRTMPDEMWDRLMRGDAIASMGDGTIHVEVDDKPFPVPPYSPLVTPKPEDQD